MKTLYFPEVDTGTDTTPETPQQNHLKAVALGFSELAKMSNDFKAWLKRQLLDRELILLDAANSPVDSERVDVDWVPSIHPAIADRKLNWLFEEIELVPKPQRQEVVRVFNLACGDTAPKAAAWGVVFVETLGVFVAGHPFRSPRLDYSQTVILGPGWNQLQPQNLTKQVSKASLAALTKCVEDADFKLERLEPEVSAWLLEGSGVKLYGAESGQDFADVLAHVRKSGLPFASSSEEVDMLALQPCINGSYDILLAGLTVLE
ncbi:MAG: hypothetical protein G01um101420_855 [Parcubacteria group bacterium Gr01-1014_20]|nr:MAG: hypothetical protein G01um101420_855 [Parcubacteria group bacterium Gr01-1014_20]